MNPETGKVYEGEDQINRAEQRGEKLVPVSNRVAKFIREARASRAAHVNKKRAFERKKQRNRAKTELERASRKANRT